MRLLVKLLVLILLASVQSEVKKRALQKSHEKPQPVKWAEAFFGREVQFDQIPSLVNLLNKIALEYLSGCHTIILYDSVVEESDGLLLQRLLKSFPLDYIHGTISSNYRVSSTDILKTSDKCVNYIVFMADVMRCLDVIGQQNTRKIVVVARSSQWRVHEFLASEVSRTLVNLLVITKSDKILALGHVSFVDKAKNLQIIRQIFRSRLTSFIPISCIQMVLDLVRLLSLRHGERTSSLDHTFLSFLQKFRKALLDIVLLFL